MTINEIYADFFQKHLNGKRFTITELTEIRDIPKELEGLWDKNVHLDAMGRSVQIGDIVAYSVMGPYKGLKSGMVVGFTKTGFRVVVIARKGLTFGFGGYLENPKQVAITVERDL